MTDESLRKMSNDLSKSLALTDAAKPDLSEVESGTTIAALQALVFSLESGLKLIRNTHYGDPDTGRKLPEPFPGACEKVIEQSLFAVRIARNAGILPLVAR